MRLSRYAKIYPYPEDLDSRLLFSAKKVSAALVPSSLIDDIEKGSLSEEEKETLVGLDILVQNHEEEEREMLAYVREINGLDTSFKYTLVLNLDCNLACKYCFEGKRKGKFYISDDTADLFIDFVRRSDFSNKKEIKITFYGGEPLLAVDQILRISEKIGSFADRKGLKYTFSLITNGTLLSQKIVKNLVPLGLKSAKVTLDGPAHVHNKYRFFKTGEASFDIIVKNIKDVCDLIRVEIGGNYTQEHYKDFPLLLDYLGQTGLTPDKLAGVKFDPVTNETSEFAPADFHDGCESINEPWVSEASVFLREEILRRGYNTRRILPSACLIELNDNFLVNYDGSLYKCPGLIGRKECCVGDLRNGVIDYRQSHGLDNWKNEECLRCSYLPLCFGGCRYMKLIRDGHMNGVDCKKQYYDNTLAQLVVQDIKYNL